MGYKQATEKLSLEPIAKASFSAIEKGIPVTTAAGNTGPHLGSLSNGMPWVLTVTASTMDRLLGATLTTSNGLKIIGGSMFVGATVLENLPLVYSKTLSRCDSYSLLHAVPKGTVLLCDIGRLELQAKSIVSSNITGAILI